MIRYSIVFALAALAVMLPEFALADTEALDKTVGKAMCEIYNAVSGKAGKAIATIAVVLMGIGAFFGKINWTLALIIALGVAIVFGAATLVNLLSAATDANC